MEMSFEKRIRAEDYCANPVHDATSADSLVEPGLVHEHADDDDAHDSQQRHDHADPASVHCAVILSTTKK